MGTEMNSSRADKIAFTAIRVPVADVFLWVDGNGKITAGNGSYSAPSPNAFSIVEIDDCPYATPTCKAACYVHGLRRARPDIHDMYEENSAVIRALLADPVYAANSALEFGRWINANCRGGFRWHVSGDVFSREYARWIHNVCLYSYSVRHWIYTRSFPYVSSLVQNGALRNLTINLSADVDNYQPALVAHYEFPDTRICYLTTDGSVPDNLPDGSVIFPDYSLRGRDSNNPLDGNWWRGLSLAQRKMVCPVDYFGASEHIRCGVCKKCL